MIWDVIYINNEGECFPGVSKHEKTMYEKTSAEREWILLIVFECLDIPVGHELELFIGLLKWVRTLLREKCIYCRGINLEKCAFSGCNITFVVDDKKWITK